MKVKIRDARNVELEGEIVKTGRRYVYVKISWFPGFEEVVPFEIELGRTSRRYEDDKNALPMWIQKNAK